jgi:hypothetical protein
MGDSDNGHVCRICEQTFSKGHQTVTFCKVLVDLKALEKQCVEIELNLRDSFNAFCFKCRHISMSVPSGVDVDAQLCYLRSQVECFNQLQAYGLILDED